MTTPQAMQILLLYAGIAGYAWIEYKYHQRIKKATMKKVIIESPYAGDVHENLKYARACIKDSLARGEAPIASHLLYTQPGILDDNNPEERKWGIDAGLAWLEVADIHAFYTDRGMSRGMTFALDHAIKNNSNIEFRKLKAE